MKKILLLLLVAGAYLSNVYAKDMETFTVTPGTCKCYCSELCGPRDVKPGIDEPFYDPEYDLCFCHPRDKVNYIPHGCNIKNPKPAFDSCCSQETTPKTYKKKTRKVKRSNTNN